MDRYIVFIDRYIVFIDRYSVFMTSLCHEVSHEDGGYGTGFGAKTHNLNFGAKTELDRWPDDTRLKKLDICSHIPRHSSTATGQQG
jgi:hypothetical protein